jgi:hypothetical protein
VVARFRVVAAAAWKGLSRSGTPSYRWCCKARYVVQQAAERLSK